MVRTTLLALSLLLLSTSVHSQNTWIGRTPRLTQPQAYFNEITGRLTIPSLQIFSADEPGESHLATVTLEQAGDEQFAVRNYSEIELPPSCTRAEILAAIPQISLDTTFEQASTLFSCSPQQSSRSSSDLQNGKLVTMSWIEGNNLQSSFAGPGYVVGYSPFFVASSSVNVVSTNGLFDQRILAPSKQASVSLTFLEGVLSYFSYSEGLPDQIEFCDDEKLEHFLQAPSVGDSLESVNATLGCKGALSGTLISADGEEKFYDWRSQPLARTTYAEPMPLPRISVSLAGVFNNGVATSFSGEFDEARYASDDCEVEELTTAATSIERGMDEATMLGMIGCDYLSKHSSFSTNGNNSTNYNWSTSIQNTSILLSPNRQLFVLVRDGSVLHSSLSRY